MKTYEVRMALCLQLGSVGSIIVMMIALFW